VTLEQYSFIAQIIGSLGVIVSLVFVGLEVRKSTAQSKLSNYSDMIDRFMSVYGMTNDPELARLIIKGRESYNNLSADEKLTFGHYLENMCIALESLLQYDRSVVHNIGESSGMFGKHIRYHLGSPGAQEWFAEFEQERGFPAPYMETIHRVLKEIPNNQQEI
jgi:hypothetical protein